MVTKEAYVNLGVRLFRVLVPNVRAAEAAEQMERDWERDAGGGGGSAPG